MISLLVNLWSQFSKDEESKLDKQKLLEKAKFDSAQFSNESIQNALRFSITSNALQRQRSIDSTKISTDSSRFNITLSKFKKQLFYQNKSLFNIQKALHPMDDFTITINYSLHIGCERPENYTNTILDYEIV